MEEIKILEACKHINVIRYKNCFITTETQCDQANPSAQLIVHIVMEYADAGDMNVHIKRQREVQLFFAEAQVRNWLVQLSLALQYLHKIRVMHRDIKTQNIFESPNVAFFGTMCTAGLGEGICFRTGDDTVIGRIANLSESAEKNQTPLSIEIERFIFIVSAVAIFLGVTFFLIGWIVKDADLVTNLVFCIGIIVANVPEGLLATVTVSLSLTAYRMS